MAYHNNEATTKKAVNDAQKFINDRERYRYALSLIVSDEVIEKIREADFKPFEESIKRPVMQFSGIKDKNGKAVNGGDLIICEAYPFYGIADGIGGFKGEYKEHNYTGEVYYWEEECAWYVELHAISDRVSGIAIGGMLSGYKNCEVIGNIYENPELLTPTNKQS